MSDYAPLVVRCVSNDMIEKYGRYVVYLVIFISIFILVLISMDKRQEVDTDFVPVFDQQEELDKLFIKATDDGLTEEELIRLDELTDDRKRQVEIQVKEHISKTKNEEQNSE